MDTLYRQITETIGPLMAELSYQAEPSPRDTAPLILLLTARHSKVCFASLDEDYSSSARQALDQFRGLYALNSDAWARYDLFLVLLAREGSIIPTDFAYQTEIDPFFCRKFVLDLRRGLREELARLPFVPLPHDEIDIGRPPRAESILLARGIPKQLAGFLARPHERGPDGIIEDCLGGQFGDPDHWKSVPQKHVPGVSTESAPVRLESIEVCNFRAFRKVQSFDLRADLVVLFGPNGLGKTSFFDAVDFLCTGGVARFDRKTVRTKHPRQLIDILKHLDSDAKDCSVSAQVRTGDGKAQAVRRIMSDRTSVQVDGAVLERKKLLMLLTGLTDDSSEKARVDILEDLFRASHAFGQEFQSLTSDFREDSSLRSDTVSSMLALRDHVETVNKLCKVIDELDRRIEELRRRTRDLEATLSERKSEFARMQELASDTQPPESVSKTASELGRRVAASLGVDVQSGAKVDKESLRSWRGTVEVRLSALNQKLVKAKALSDELPGLESHQQESMKSEERIRVLNSLLVEFRRSAEVKKMKLQEIEAQLRAQLSEERMWRSTKDNSTWLLKAAEEWRGLQKTLTEVENAKADAARLAAEFKQQTLALGRTIADLSSAQDKLKTEMVLKAGRQAALAELAETLPTWTELLGQQLSLAQRIESNSKERASRERKLLILRQDLESAVKLESELDARCNVLQEQDSERQRLLSGIERYLEGNVCPVCGVEHSSRETLLRRYTAQMGVRPATLQVVMAKRAEASKRTADLRSQLQEQETRLQKLVQDQALAESDFAEAKRNTEWPRSKAGALGLGTEPAAMGPAIANAQRVLANEKASCEQEIGRLEQERAKARERSTELSTQERAAAARVTECESKKTQLQMHLGRLEEEALARGVSLQDSGESIRSRLETADKTLTEIAQQTSRLDGERQQLTAELQLLQGNEEVTAREVTLLSRTLSDAKERLARVASLARELGLPAAPARDAVEASHVALKEERALLSTLRDDTASLELATDAAQASAASVALRSEVSRTEEELEVCRRHAKELQKWRSRFSGDRERVSSKQKDIVAGYAGRYGPLTSNIQKRLRGVYGFGDVRLQTTSDQRIAIWVEREGLQQLAPSDYFSQSQLQILMLSLFLSAVLTQNWSSFAPVLLDDPVTHFDDMNTYSLVDLLDGLLSETSESSCKRQFLISTCEERFFRLLQQRFSGANDKAIFYVFESIGRDGPKIKRLD